MPLGEDEEEKAGPLIGPYLEDLMRNVHLLDPRKE